MEQRGNKGKEIIPINFSPSMVQIGKGWYGDNVIFTLIDGNLDKPMVIYGIYNHD
jgi:hypothetical protein